MEGGEGQVVMGAAPSAKCYAGTVALSRQGELGQSSIDKVGLRELTSCQSKSQAILEWFLRKRVANDVMRRRYLNICSDNHHKYQGCNICTVRDSFAKVSIYVGTQMRAWGSWAFMRGFSSFWVAWRLGEIIFHEIP